MSTPTWKQIIPKTNVVVPTIPLLHARTSFAVDASRSTAGKIMKAQEELVLELAKDYPSHHSVIMWGTGAELPTSVQETRWSNRSWGTHPDEMFSVPQVTAELKSCDVWYLLTDGEVFDPALFAATTMSCGLSTRPVVFLIVNFRPSKPSRVDISVGLPVFASAPDAMIAFKDTSRGKIFVLAAQGTFAPLVAEHEIDLEDWGSLPTFEDNASFKHALGKTNEIIEAVDRPETTTVDLGTRWNERQNSRVDLDLLLAQLGPQSVSQTDLLDLLEEEAFNRLTLLCKTRGLLTQLRHWLVVRKDKASVVELRDVAEAGKFLERLRAVEDHKSAEADALRIELRKAHADNMADYKMRSSGSKTSPLLLLVNQALTTLTAMEKSGYSADILDRRSNRAMRAEVVHGSQVTAGMANLELGDDDYAHRDTCEICCSEDVIMSLAFLKSTAPADNTTDFALNMPLHAGASVHNEDVLSSQYVCFQCALILQELRGSIYQENVVAILPLVGYEGTNRACVDKALPLIFTDGLATGASGLTQLLMAVLLNTIKTKKWAMEGQDTEIERRRSGILWILEELVKKSSCRETFDEGGEWVPYPKALAWALRNFHDEKIYSWIVRYSVTGLAALLEIIDIAASLEPSLALTIPDDLRVAKLMYEMVSLHMAKILDTTQKQKAQHHILTLVYADFNADNVPQELGDDNVTSSICPPSVFTSRLAEWAPPLLMRYVEGIAAIIAPYIPAIQYLAFTLAKEENHQTPKGFLQRSADADVHFHTAVNNPREFDAASSISRYTAFFAGRGQVALTVDHINVTSNTIPPFVTAYGASTLHCGVHGCSVRFDVEGTGVEAVRNSRTKHMMEAYAIPGVEWKNLSGMPENTARLAQPTSMHVNMHSSIVRSWHDLAIEERRLVLGGGDEEATERFVEKVLEYICVKNGRGNIYRAGLKGDTRKVLPSFLGALRKAAEKKELADAVDFVHDFKVNTLETRIGWELDI